MITIEFVVKQSGWVIAHDDGYPWTRLELTEKGKLQVAYLRGTRIEIVPDPEAGEPKKNGERLLFSTLRGLSIY